MANRRMGTRKITGTMDFLNLPKAAQALYQQFINESDDDGINDARLIMKVGNFRKRDLDALIEGDYVRLINAKKNIIWVTNWQSFNTIKSDKGTPSVYREDLLRSVPDIKNALFTPNTNKKGRTKYSLELESESESELEESRSELESVVESESKTKPNISRMFAPSHDFFIEQCPDVLEYDLQNLSYAYGKTAETKLTCVVAIKLFRLELWKPKTCIELAKRFTELNSHGLKQNWNDGKWQKMLEGFVDSEYTESDYDDWIENQDAESELPFS